MTQWTGEAEPGRPWWWEAVAPEVTEDGLPEQCDVLVIGAGYTGLSAAIAAHDSGAKVVVVEARVPGDGASSRNGGMVGAHPRLSWGKMAAAFGAEVADALWPRRPRHWTGRESSSRPRRSTVTFSRPGAYSWPIRHRISRGRSGWRKRCVGKAG